jgi:hypothetical protein
MLNPFFILSLLILKVCNFCVRLKNYKYLMLSGALNYPPDFAVADPLIEELFPKIFRQRCLSDLRFELKQLNRFELNLIYKYFNLKHLKFETVICFHHILRTNINPVKILSPFGLSRFLISRVLVSIILDRRGNIFIFSIDSIVNFTAHICRFNIENFRKVKNLSYAVVGGGPSPRVNTQEINSFDRVVTLTPHRDAVNSNTIHYLRAEKGDYIINNKLTEQLDKNPIVITKLHRHYKYLKNHYGNRIEILTSTTFDFCLDFGKLNAVQNICFDLLRFKPKKVKIFNTDLNLSMRHGDGYRDIHMPRVEFQSIFGEHPAIIQFLVLKYFSSKSNFEFEKNPNFDTCWGYRKFIKEFHKIYVQ